MKTLKITYWITTWISFLFDSVMPAFTFDSKMAREGIRHLRYPDYSRIELSLFKIIGGILLILSMIRPKYKEWASSGFGISVIFVIIGH